MQETVIELKGLTKKYDQKVVVDHVSLAIKKGEIFGLLGPNGAGKSTTINLITSLIRPTAGDISVFGLSTKKDLNKIKDRLGVVPQELAIHGGLKAWENVELFAALYGIKGKALKEAINSSLEFVGLTEHRNSFAKTFSGGMKRRLNIACALSHNPDLLIFDEPTVGIDPQSRNFILERIKLLNKGGTTILYTSHYMEEIELLCNRIAIMDNGKIIALGTKEELVSLVSSNNPNISLEEVFLSLTGKSLRDYGGEVF